MELANTIIGIVSHVISCCKKHVNYLCSLDEKLKQLKVKMEQLNEIKNDVNNKVIVAEEQLMVRTSQVNGWMQRVEVKGREVDEFLLKGAQHLERGCLIGCCPKNCWSRYKLGKRVVKELLDVEEIRRNGAFTTVAENPPRALGEEQPENFTVGLDLLFKTALDLLGKYDVRFLGLYGVGGVGKTTLLKKINNELSKSNNGFDIIIWVVISRELNVRTVQEAIGQRLGLSWNESKSLSSRAIDIFTALKMKKFLILLDDVWEEIDLQSIGIPHPNAENNSKIVLTTRSLDVCGSMGAHDKIEVNCLNKDQSWILFEEKVGPKTLAADPQIPELAKKVVKKCQGLPLALITIGASMASKTNPREWQCAISDLTKCAPKFPGMEERVLNLLKFSYDRLPSDIEKVCFLFCALYPEDYQIDIEILIEKWIVLGYINSFEVYEEALNRGHSIIGTLKRTCLLEEVRDHREEVKMHDLIRELALWIARECGREEGKVFVKSGKPYTDLLMTDLSPAEVQTISLIETEVSHLERLPSCPNLSTFFAPRVINIYFTELLLSMPDDFFLSMPALKFLDLAGNYCTKVPTSFCQLLELEYLDLSYTDITSLPYEMRNLTKLKYLSVYSGSRLGFGRSICKIPCGMIKNFSNMEILKVIDTDGVDIDELGCLNKLKALDIELSDFKDIEKFVSYPRLCNSARNLIFKFEGCKEITFLTLSSSSSSLSHLCLGRFRQLRRLDIRHSSEIKEWIFTNESEIGLFESLEEMELIHLLKLVISWDSRNLHSGAHFRKLHSVKLVWCEAMVDLTWLLLIPNLQTLYIQNCDGLQEIISSFGDESGRVYDQNTFSNLKQLTLYYLPNLGSICSMSALPFPSLETIDVKNCPKLRRLPFDSNSANNTLQMIRGEEGWRNGLQWDNEAIKTQFTKFMSNVKICYSLYE